MVKLRDFIVLQLSWGNAPTHLGLFQRHYINQSAYSPFFVSITKRNKVKGFSRGD